MNKKFNLLSIVIMMTISTFMLQGCHNNEANDQQAVQAAQRAAEASEKAAEAAQRAAEAVEAATPVRTVRTSGETVGWGSLTSEERAEIIAIGKDHPYGGVIRPEPPIKEVTFILYIENVPSATPKQTLIEYTYETDNGEGTNRILVQGHFESISSVSSIPDVLNNNSCCIFYGGSIQEYGCTAPLPKAEKCDPCKSQPKEECKPCQQASPSPGKKQGDGAVPETKANGTNRKISVGW